MDIGQTRTFLAIAAHGSFLEAARQMHLTQSTISARIKRLEDELGTRLFVRNRSGATLTASGHRFLDYAKRLVLTADQARDDVGLSDRYHASIRIGGRIALWDGFLPEWVGWMRSQSRDVVVRSEIGFDEDLMRRIIEGTMDIALMYTPSHGSGLVVEHLFDEQLVLVSTRADDTGPGDDYIYIEWGPAFYAQHSQNYPDLEQPPQVANIGWLGVQIVLKNGGSCFLPRRMVDPLVESGLIHRVKGSPEFLIPVYMVFQRETGNQVIDKAVGGLRLLAAAEHNGDDYEE